MDGWIQKSALAFFSILFLRLWERGYEKEGGHTILEHCKGNSLTGNNNKSFVCQLVEREEKGGCVLLLTFFTRAYGKTYASLLAKHRLEGK